MGGVNFLDTVLVPLSVFLTVGYHTYLWHYIKNTPSVTATGINSLKRRDWVSGIQEGNDKKEMLAVQSLRNKLMDTILTATMTIMIIISVAGLASASYRASKDIFSISTLIFGVQTMKIIALKYGSTTMLMSMSFVCNSLGIGFLVDANFLINANSGGLVSVEYVECVLERGFLMATVGTRLLCIGFTLLMWMLSPWAVVLSSVALVRGLYELDFPSSLRRNNK